MKRKFMTFWAINGALNLDKLKEQLAAMKELGFDGVVFHPRFYPGKPAYLSKEYMGIVSDLILYAKKIGMEFWIYDEDGWPSGRAGGQVFQKVPDCTAKWFTFEEGKVVWHEKKTVSTFSIEAMDAFEEITFDGYRKGLAPEAFDYVTGFFSDEVELADGASTPANSNGGVPWDDSFEEDFRKLYGMSILENLHKLFVEEGDYQEIRYRYWEMCANLLAKNFYRRLNSWCEKYGKKYTAHLKGEENLFFQVSASVSAFRQLKEVNVPAIDALERFPSNHYFPKIPVSVARQFGNGEAVTEAIGGAGFGLNPENFENYVAWLCEAGITTLIFHISQYEANSKSILDWPSNIPFGVTWKEVFPSLFKKLHKRFDLTEEKPHPVLVVAPERRVLSLYNPKKATTYNVHSGAHVPDFGAGAISNRYAKQIEMLYQKGLEFDVTSEFVLEESGKLVQDETGKTLLQVGKARYQQVIFSDDCFFLQQELTDACKKKGIGFLLSDFSYEIKEVPYSMAPIIEFKPETYLISPDFKGPLWVRALEEVKDLRVNGVLLTQFVQNGRYFDYEVSKEAFQAIKQTGRINVMAEKVGRIIPFLYVYGPFLVKSNSPFVETDERQVKTEGRLELVPQDETKLQTCDLISSGLMFANDGVVVSTYCYVNQEGLVTFNHVDLSMFDGGNGSFQHPDLIHMDAMKVHLLGKDYYTWGDSWSFQTEGVTSGIYPVSCTWIPSTYNIFGPHHYVRGDYKLICENEYKGVRCFVDEDEEQEYTLESAWHFVKFGIEEVE